MIRAVHAYALALAIAGACRQPPPPPPPAPPPPPPVKAEPVVSWSTGAASRVMVKNVAVSIPARVRLVDNAFDLVIHFHGLPELQEKNVERSDLGVIVASINVGVGSGQYEDAYRKPRALESLTSAALEGAAKSGRFGDAPKFRKLALWAWSAGFGSIAAIFHDKETDAVSEVDAILLADGVFTSWENEKKKIVKRAPIDFLVDYAARAKRGEKLLAITHSAIPTQGYPSMTETMDFFTAETGLTREPPVGDGGIPAFPATYTAHSGSLYVTGYKGTTVDAHIAQVTKMSQTLIPLLKARWTK